jgi:phosphatidylserine decarboxylase
MDNRKTIDTNNLKEAVSLRFLYKNLMGRIILKGLTLPFISSVVGAYMNSPLSKIRINKFIRQSGIDMSEYEDENYTCFNHCFTRKIKDGERPFPASLGILPSPCDGKVSAYKISEGKIFPIKGSYYTVSQLLENSTLGEKYHGGTCVVLRLAVDDYHRYSYIDNGTKEDNVFIKGVLHTVQPIALNMYPVFVRNSREYTVMHTENFGDVVQVEVGALMVGKIKNFHKAGKMHRGAEKGMFLFGGSTIVLLFQKDKVEIDSELFENTEKGLETIVKLGEPIGKKI